MYKRQVEDYPTIRKGKPPLYNVGTNQAKKTLMARFHQEGRVVLTRNLPKEVIPELMSEKEVIGNKNGRRTKKWIAVPGIERNEALDCSVYTLALHRLTRFKFRQKAEPKEQPPPESEEKTEETAQSEPEPANNMGMEYSPEEPAPKRRNNMFRVYNA